MRLAEALDDVAFVRAVEDGGRDLEPEDLRRDAEMDLKHLTDVHTGRNAQRVQNDVERRTVGKERHVFGGQDARNDALVPVAARHLVADRDLSLLGDIDADDLVDAGSEVGGIGAVVDLDVHDDARLAVRQAERRIADLARLLAEDRAEQTLLGGEFGLALRGDFTDQDIAGADLGTDLDDTVAVQILQRVVADVRDLAGDLLRAEFGVARLDRVFLNVDRGVNVLADQTLVQKDGVLVVVALPGHKADQRVLAERDLAVRRCRTVGDHLTRLDPFALCDDGALVDRGALVGAFELQEFVDVFSSAVGQDDDLVRRDAFDHAALVRDHDRARVERRLVLHTGRDDRRLGGHQRHRLLLHVGAHQRTGVIVVFKEGDHRRGDRDQHLGRGVHITDLLGFDLDDLGLVAGDDAGVDEMSVLGQRLVRLRDDITVLDVGGHVLDLLRHDAVLDLAVGRLEESVLVDAGVGGKIGDQTDVRTFRRFDRAHSPVLGVMHVADVEGGAVTGKTAGTERRETPFVRQFGERVVLIHELRERRRAEELADRRRHRAGVDERLRGHLLAVVHRHPLLDVLLHPGETDADLILQEFPDRTETTVAEVVDVVDPTDAVGQADQVVDRGVDILFRNVLGREFETAAFRLFLDPVGVHRAALDALDNLVQNREPDLLADAAVGKVVAEHPFGTDGVVRHHLDRSALFVVDADGGHARLLDRGREFGGEKRILFGDDLARHRADRRVGKAETDDAFAERRLLVELIASDRREVVAFGIEEGVLQKGARALDERGLARAHLHIDLFQRFFARRGLVVHRPAVGFVLREGGGEILLLAEGVDHVGVGLGAEGADQDRHRDLPVLVDLDPEGILRVGLIFEPSAVIRDHRAGIAVFTGLVHRGVVVHTRRTDQLRHHDALRAVDDEGPVVGHQREVPHEDLVLLDVVGLEVGHADADLEGRLVGHVALLAFLYRIAGIRIDRVTDEIDLRLAHEIDDRRRVAQHLVHSDVKKPPERFLLHLDQVRHLEDVLDLGKTLPLGFPEILGFQLHEMKHSFFIFAILAEITLVLCPRFPLPISLEISVKFSVFLQCSQKIYNDLSDRKKRRKAQIKRF